jgi:Fe/S biogenesis protein NfuA
MLLTVTEAAQVHFRTLLQKEAAEGTEDGPRMNLRVYVANPGTSYADIGVTFCPEGDEEPNDIFLEFENFHLYVEKASEEALQEAKIDFEDNIEGGQLSIKAPYLKGRAPVEGSSLHDRIEYVLHSEVNPSLAGHGGSVKLVDIIEDDTIIILQFGGGCHGCGMANVTLKNGIEKTLKEKFPEIIEVRDATDHAAGSNPYY